MKQSSELIGIYAFPLHLSGPNGYWDGLYGQIKALQPCALYHNDFWGLLFSRHRRRVIHIHWPTALYGSRIAWLLPFQYCVRRFILAIAHGRGDRLVWTVHNYQNHEHRHRWFDRHASRYLARRADAVIVHTQAGQAYIAQTFGRRQAVYVIAHGNYIGFHGPRLVQPDARLVSELALPQVDTIFLSIGSIRPYKDIERIISIFNHQPANVALLIAGKAYDAAYLEQLRQLVTNSHIIIRPGSIPHDQLPRYFSVGVCSIYAFNEVLTSGSVILSLSYGVPVIVPAAGDLPHLIIAGKNGWLFEDDQEFERQIQMICAASLETRRQWSEQAIKSVEPFDYTTIARQTLSTYNL